MMGKGLDVKALGPAQSSLASSLERKYNLTLEDMGSDFSPGVSKNAIEVTQ